MSVSVVVRGKRPNVTGRRSYKIVAVGGGECLTRYGVPASSRHSKHSSPEQTHDRRDRADVWESV